MKIPSGQYCDEPFTREDVCAFFYDACPFSYDKADEPVLLRQSIEGGFETAFERCSACLAAYPNGATIKVIPVTTPAPSQHRGWVFIQGDTADIRGPVFATREEAIEYNDKMRPFRPSGVVPACVTWEG